MSAESRERAVHESVNSYTQAPSIYPAHAGEVGSSPFDSAEHLFEVKWHGTRVLAFVDQDGYRLVNRHRVYVSDRYPELGFLVRLPAGVILDGEIVVLRQVSRTSGFCYPAIKPEFLSKFIVWR